MSTRARPPSTRPTLTLPPAVAYRLPGDARSVGWARKELRRHLRIWRVQGELAWTAELLLSELITSAVQAQACRAQTVGVRFALADGRLRLEVHDASDEVPVMDQAEEDEECGRGVVLVDALASCWGVDRDVIGKTVWAEVELTVCDALVLRPPSL
ncbi:ATP-binding protein [Streptomyces natalensis]|uniref:ATP-binding protein n=1 Tax=Streptomyces natalensis TaxID=68242 RepID=UPI000AE09A93|nr:ATP-binding protein [Streptomyces natalensis]